MPLSAPGVLSLRTRKSMLGLGKRNDDDSTRGFMTCLPSVDVVSVPGQQMPYGLTFVFSILKGSGANKEGDCWLQYCPKGDIDVQT
jgi:hypothetical protein